MLDWVPKLPDDGKPKYLAIVDVLAEDIKAGVLKAGSRLPPQRRLASKLGIDFTTVTRAYSEAQNRGIIESQVGRGTFVAQSARQGTQPDPERARSEDLTMNMPPEPTDPALIQKMQNGLNYVSTNLVDLLRYQSSLGGEKDKIAASSWLSLRGMVPKLERVAITPGAHATMTAILSILAKPGDHVLCENITYAGIRKIARRMGIKLVGIEMDEEGILPDALNKAIKEHNPVALYLNPTLHNPTTLTMTTDRRIAVSQIINKRKLPLIEDDAYGFIPDRAPAPIAVLSPEYTWHIGGLAKCIGAGLRLAYTVTPSAQHTLSLGQVIQTLSVMPSPISMALATFWIEDGTADHIRRFIRSETAIRQKMAAEAFSDLEFKAAENAFNVWLRLPKGAARADIIASMTGRHIGITPSDAFTINGQADEYVRVCLGGSIDRERLQSNLHYMAHLLSPYGFMI
ncbi:MAG: PLP-dependent aminotransferase family protein [Cohaesibacter sp.]|nr:PLP-dependent aminotransferase family protein [Cohaesibacter sp.]